MQEGDRCCVEVIAGLGLVAAGAELLLLVQEGGRCCVKVVAGAKLVAAGVELVVAGAGR